MHAVLPLLAVAVATATPVSHLTATRTHQFTVSLPVDETFPLFEPIGEKAWAEGWHPVFASAESATLSDGSVFTVQHGDLQTIWLVTHYSRSGHAIEYRLAAPG